MQNDECRMQNEEAKSRMFPVWVILLFLLGLICWPIVFSGFHSEFLGLGSLGPIWLGVYILACAAAAWMPPVAGPIDRLLNRFRVLSPRARVLCSVMLGILATVYLWITAATQHRQFFPYIHDEFSYLIQAHQLAVGRLWMPAHPLAKFFDSFQLFVQPVYASAYFPGTALLYVPGVWLHLAPYVSSLIIAGAVAGLVFWLAAELIDCVAAMLAVLLLLSDGVFRQMSLVTMGQMPLLLYGLFATVAWLRWRRVGKSKWLILIGLFLGLAAITRPVDALCFAIPIGIAVVYRDWKQSWKMGIGVLPLVCLQLIVNHGITGHLSQTPFGLYADREYPGTGYGFHPFDAAAGPVSDLPQKQALYRDYLPILKLHQPGNMLDELLHAHGPFDGQRLGLTFSQYPPAPFPLLVLLLPLSLLSLKSGRGVVLAGLPLFVLLYIPYVFFFPHYVLCAAPALIVGILLGAKVLGESWKSGRRFREVGLTLLIAGVVIAALPQWNAGSEDLFQADLLASVNQQLAALPHRPAVVLFTYDPKRNTHEEPVYNADVAWPDDMDIVRAHDLGAANQAIFDYYADRRPARYFYRFDERDRSVHVLGTAAELGHAHTGPAASGASTAR
jgi:hypothetical protein